MDSKNFRKNGSKKSKENPVREFKCDRECDKIPSKFNCVTCCLNYLKTVDYDSPEDEELSFEEKIQKLDNFLEEINYIFLVGNQMKDAVLDRKKNVIIEYKKWLEESLKRTETEVTPAETIDQQEQLMVLLEGFKNVIFKKFGFFFFNENNENGLKLHRIDIDKVKDFILKNFKDEDGEVFSERSLTDGLNEGSRMPQDKKFLK